MITIRCFCWLLTTTSMPGKGNLDTIQLFVAQNPNYRRRLEDNLGYPPLDRLRIMVYQAQSCDDDQKKCSTTFSMGCRQIGQSLFPLSITIFAQSRQQHLWMLCEQPKKLVFSYSRLTPKQIDSTYMCHMQNSSVYSSLRYPYYQVIAYH